MSIESDNPWLLGIGAVCIAVPILAAVGLAVFAAVRKKEGGGLAAGFYAAVAGFVLLLLFGIWLIAHAANLVAAAPVASRFDAGPGGGPAWDGRPPDSTTAPPRDVPFQPERRLAALPGTVVIAPPAPETSIVGLTGAVLGAFAAGLALAALAQQRPRPRASAVVAEPDDPAPQTAWTTRAALTAQLTRQAQLELDRWLDDDDDDASDGPARRPAADAHALGALLKTLADLLRATHPEHPDFVWPPRFEPVESAGDASADDTLRRALGRVDRALDAGGRLAHRPDPERLEAAMRALRRALVRKPPTKPRLGPGIHRGGAP